MPDREKVIKGLVCCDYCNSVTNSCYQCPYLDLNKAKGMAMCTAELAHDALALLREQEPVKPIEKNNQIVCGSCGEKLAEICGDVDVVWNDDGKYPRYCPGCGRAVKWDADGA